jgi:hypothetical protein
MQNSSARIKRATSNAKRRPITVRKPAYWRGL